MADAIALDGLERRYGDRVVLHDLTLAVPAGATLTLFGANGAGKTTLLRILATLLRPHDGTAEVLGSKLPDDAWRVRGRVGLLGHEPLLYPQLSARENLTLHARLHGVPHERIDAVLDAVGLRERAGDPVDELSKGMVQRLAAARAVLHDPPLLLLDEPRAGLDPAAAEQLEPLIGRSSGRTRVLVTHDVDRGLEEGDVVVGLRDGRAEPCADAAAVRRLYG
ncbi:MAG TPA: ABC transporter ATP-binding protein [Thermoleophilaceae bacterium]